MLFRSWQLRTQHYDIVIDLHGGPRSSWLTWATGAPMRIGYTTLFRSRVVTEMLSGVRFSSDKGSLEVRVLEGNFSISLAVVATGNSALGRGVHGAIPLHLVMEAKNIDVSPDKPLKYRIALTVSAADLHR